LAEVGQGAERRPGNGANAQRAWYWLLIIPFLGLLPVPLYAHEDPELFGFPFFYWYQFAWVPITSLLVWFVYTKTR
jgi:hypothetical protein